MTPHIRVCAEFVLAAPARNVCPCRSDAGAAGALEDGGVGELGERRKALVDAGELNQGDGSFISANQLSGRI